MRDKKVGQPVLALQPPQQVHNLRSHAHIQRRNGLIQNQQLRPERQRARNVDPLPLPAAELVRMPSQRRLIQPHFAQQFHGLGS